MHRILRLPILLPRHVPPNRLINRPPVLHRHHLINTPVHQQRRAPHARRRVQRAEVAQPQHPDAQQQRAGSGEVEEPAPKVVLVLREVVGQMRVQVVRQQPRGRREWVLRDDEVEGGRIRGRDEEARGGAHGGADGDDGGRGLGGAEEGGRGGDVELLADPEGAAAVGGVGEAVLGEVEEEAGEAGGGEVFGVTEECAAVAAGAVHEENHRAGLEGALECLPWECDVDSILLRNTAFTADAGLLSKGEEAVSVAAPATGINHPRSVYPDADLNSTSS
eukprot:CAMPEP_0184728902 /NCGR_PEP_ID=MMETSP0314-20130426/42333_1 /TAXON_ID=38298 /ORGANISM="Rhodella maculata, Strain CCMP 736" /LENGTH=276 /DNA_ID=CAMNT_0027194847 /DNA_START=297 /DNA_END=1128 /DNA_ORIENTATION=+